MAAVGSNTWLVPSELALTEAFLAIFSYEYRGIKLKVKIELTPLHRHNVYCVFIEWESPSNIGLYHFMKTVYTSFRVERITLSLV